MLLRIGWVLVLLTAALAQANVPSLSPRDDKKPECPNGQEACRNPQGEGHVCVDTKSSFESCGGCVHGRFGEEVRLSAKGEDCSHASGITPTGAKCEAGVCVVKECREGYFMRDYKGEPTCIYDVYGVGQAGVLVGMPAEVDV